MRILFIAFMQALKRLPISNASLWDSFETYRSFAVQSAELELSS
jgi:hypothetical protein